MTAGEVAQEQESVQTAADAAPVAGPRWVRPADAEPAWEGLPVSYEDVEAARETLRGVSEVSPLQLSRSLSRAVGTDVHLKCENLQRAGSFKIRGAYVRMAGLSEAERVRGGDKKVIGFLVGQVMKATGGKANPQAVNELVKAKLGL